MWGVPTQPGAKKPKPAPKQQKITMFARKIDASTANLKDSKGLEAE
eukprot:gene740-5419_t